MKRMFPRQLDSLDALFEWVGEFAATHGLDADFLFSVNLALEEAFVNTIRHNDSSTTDVEIGLEVDGHCLTVIVIDPDTDPFDLTKAGNVDTTRPAHERKPGGLGVFLIKRLMDDVTYEHSDRVSTIRMMKKLEPKNV